MIDHHAAETLMAAAIDFPLSPEEQSALTAHLAGCDRCGAVGAQLRRHALGLRDLPVEGAPPRMREMVAAARVDARATTPRLTLLLAAALLVALAISGAVIVGSGLLDLDVVTVNPSPTTPSSEAPVVVDLPAGTLIAYVERSGNTSFIHTIEPDGANDRSLAEGSAPAWSPDGGSIAFVCHIPSNSGDICLIGAAAAAHPFPISDAINPRYSPDGRRMLFSRSAIDLGDTWIANADGTQISRIGDGTGSWSPDGSWVMLVSGSGVPIVNVVRPDGSEFRELGEGWGAAWSPDGRRIAFAWDGELRAFDIADGSVATLLEAVPGDSLVWIAEDLIVIGSNDGLYMLNLGSGDLVQLVHGLSIPRPPVVSPDGQWLAFTTYDGEATDIYLASILGGGAVRLTTGGVSDQPTWQPRAPAPSFSPDPSDRPPLSYPPLTDAGSHATVIVDRLTVYDFAGSDFPVVAVTELGAGTDVFLASGPLTNGGLDWYEVYFSWLPEDAPYFADFTFGWIAAGPTGQPPTSIRIDPPRCPEVFTANVIGNMSNLARLQCLGTGPHEVTGVLAACTDFCGWNLFNEGGLPLFIFFPPDYPEPAGLDWWQLVRIVGHVDDPSASDCGADLEPPLTELDRARLILECRSRFVLSEFEVTGQSEPLL